MWWKGQRAPASTTAVGICDLRRLWDKVKLVPVNNLLTLSSNDGIEEVKDTILDISSSFFITSLSRLLLTHD